MTGRPYIYHPSPASRPVLDADLPPLISPSEHTEQNKEEQDRTERTEQHSFRRTAHRSRAVPEMTFLARRYTYSSRLSVRAVAGADSVVRHGRGGRGAWVRRVAASDYTRAAWRQGSELLSDVDGVASGSLPKGKTGANVRRNRTATYRLAE